MQTIICKKCGAVIDASLHECPVCGAVNTAVAGGASPQDSPSFQSREPARRPEYGHEIEKPVSPPEYVREFDPADYAPTQSRNMQEPPVHDPETLGSIGSEDIFNTTVWKTDEGASHTLDPDATRPFTAVPPMEERTYRPAAPTPTRAQPMEPRRAPQQPRMQQPTRTQQQTRVPQRQQPVHYVSHQEAEQDEEKGHRKKLVIWAIALLALLTLVLTVMSGAFNFSDKSPSIDMPNVVGQTQEEATKVLENLGLKVETTKADDDSPKGTVVRQSIKEGKKIKEGDTVTLSISTGESGTSDDADKEEVRVPSLKGQTYEQALKQIEAAGLLMTTAKEEYDASVPAGQVISQTPASGTNIKKGEVVTVVISKGPEASPSPASSSVTALAGTGGSISPKGMVSVANGGSQTFTITPQTGFVVKEVKVDGVDVGAVGSYTFSNVTEGHTIYAVFEKAASSETAAPAE